MNLDCYQTLTTIVVGQMVGTRLSSGAEGTRKVPFLPLTR